MRVLSSTKVQLAGLITTGLLLWAGLTVWAFTGWGVWAGFGFAVFAIIGLAVPWIYVRVLFTPFGKNLLGTGFLMLAQLTFGAGALVRRDNGSYEWRRLREDDGGLFTVLSTGERVGIDGDRGDLPKVAWGPLAIVEHKTESNMERFTVSDSFETERPDPATDGATSVKTPLRLADGGVSGWHIDATNVERWTHDAAGAELPRSGLRKALEEKGGEQNLSQLWLAMMAGVLVVLGFVLGYGALLL